MFADFDNDGNKDLFISSGIVKRPVDLDYIRFVSDLYVKKGANKTDKYDNDALSQMPDGSSKPFLYKGDGALMFDDVSDMWGTGDMKGYYNGAAYADLDNDGDLDLIVSALEVDAVLLKNNTPAKNWLSVSFKGEGANTKGVGAKAYVFHAGKMQFQQLMHTRGFQSSVDARLYFGLDASTPDSVLIVWPDQRYQVIRNPTVNTALVVDQKNASSVFNHQNYFNNRSQYLTSVSTADWKHAENDFDDFNVQYLIPHMQSARGPKIATADVNGDGLTDMYISGAKGQAGAIIMQQQPGVFAKPDTTSFFIDKDAEDVDAIFFDANGDGYVDLFVASGGNEYTGRNKLLADRLYLNNGKGKFTKSETFPQLFTNKSCVSSADVDKDGDVDLFVGTLADARAFGVSQTSYLLLNDGKANFSIAPKNLIDLDAIGMVTDAVFEDINKDGMEDIVVVGEWMPVTVFIQSNGKFNKSELANTTGLWQTIYSDDLNKDGHADMLLGNWGYNSKLWSGKDGPLKLYVSDYDKNGQTDQLLSYTVGGKEYPFLAKDEVERPLPLLKKHYLKYEEYAGVVMKDVFYGWIDTIKPLVAERLGSAVAYNDGKGNFTVNDLPAEMQLAPVMAFEKLNESSYIAGGNFFDVIPYEGKYDAQPLVVFTTTRDTVTVAPPASVPFIKGQVRDLKMISLAAGQRMLAVGINNDSIRLMKLNRE